MAIDASLMAALMKIPYFAKLSEDNGEEWLSAVFEALEVETYDFSQYASLGIDPVLDTSIAGLKTGDIAPDKADSVKDGENKDDDAGEGGKSAAKSNRVANEEIHAAINAKGMETEVPVKAAANGSSEELSGRQFDNERSEFTGPAPSSSDWNRYLVHQILQQRAEQADKFSMNDSEEPGTVGLNGEYKELKLSAFDDKIFTTSAYDGDGKTNVNAGDGTDTLFLTAGGLKADLAGTSDFGKHGGKVELKSVENVIGSDGADTINGDNADNKLVGGGGDDKISGGGGNDTISGGPGKNTLSGDGGSDKITGGSGVDIIDGGAGNDTINGQAGADKISGGDGADKIKGGAGDDAIDGDGGDDEIDGGAGDDEINGGGGDDVIDGGAGIDTVDGGGGDDEIDGGDGDDDLSGGDGADTITGGVGNDTVDGGADDDEVDGGEGDDEIDGGEGADTLNGDEGNDTVNGGEGADDIDGGDGNDELNGDAGADTIVGAAGTDTIDGGADADDIDGGADNDVILGGDGNDVLKGGAGDDTITGGAGGDTITGGAGADVYIYAAQGDSGLAVGEFDVYTDFDIATDKFDLQALLAGDTFEFLDAEGTAFTGTDKEVRWDKNGGRTIIEIDLNGDGNADMKFELDDEVDLTDSNFIL